VRVDEYDRAARKWLNTLVKRGEQAEGPKPGLAPATKAKGRKKAKRGSVRTSDRPKKGT